MNEFTNIKDKSPISTTMAVIILVTYFLAYFILIPLVFVAIDYLVVPGFSANPIVDVSFHTVMTLLFLFLSSKLLSESNKHWNRKALYMPFIGAAVMMWGSFFIGIAVDLISGQSESMNQALLLEQFKINKVSIMVQAIIFAPIVEEIVFRGIIYRHFKRAGRYLIPLIVSTLLFATMHSLNAIILGQWSDLWYIPLYAFMSLVLTYVYENTQNLYSSMMLHCINNTISILVMLLMVN